MRGKWLLLVRRFHLYLSVFFAPLLLLFVITGWAQTTGFSLHDKTGSSIMERLSDVHKRQYFPAATSNPPGKWSFAGKTNREHLVWPTKWLVIAMCTALTVSIALGIILAFTTVRNRIPVWIALILGIATPVLFLALGHLK